MQEQQHYELRARGNRSRSMTPSKLQKNPNDEPANYNLRRRRSATPASTSEVTSSNHNNNNPTVVLKSIMELDNDLEKSDTVLIRKTSERRSERLQKSSKKTTVNGQTTSATTAADKKLLRTSDYSSEEGDRDDQLSMSSSAFEFYKQKGGGDYWNKLPKTDYTYSPSSKDRYEVAPNVIAPPNMSRRSLRSTESLNLSSEDDRVVYTDKVPQVVPHIRVSNPEQYTVFKKTHVTQYTTRHDSIYDSADENMVNERIYEKWASPLRNNNRFSDTEMDDEFAFTSNSKYANYKNYSNNSSQRVKKLSSVVSTCFFAIFHLLTLNGFKRKEESYSSQYLRSYQESRWSKLRRWIDIGMQHMYLLLVKVLLLDSWLLSRASNIRESVRPKTILMLLLLPLAVAFGWYLLSYMSASSLHQRSSIPHDINSNNYAKYNEELRNQVDLLLERVRNLEESKSHQKEELKSVSESLEELKQNHTGFWDTYDKKIVSLEHTLDNQSNEIKKCKSEELSLIKDELSKLKLMYAELKSCCDESKKVSSSLSPDQQQEENLKKQAERVIAGYFPSDFSKQDIVRLFQIMNSKIEGTSTQTADDNDIRRIVTEVLKVYDADKTGRVDYALESAGGQIVSTRCTQRYNIHTRAFKILGLTLYYESNNPRTVIQGNNLQPGMCWAFQDFPGYLLVKLRSPIYITGFTVEHAPKANLPNGEIKSAPKRFEVWGLKEENDSSPVSFGEYEFLDNDESLQFFPVQNSSISTAYEYVEMRIHSNHGQLEYTCLYRFRVHGKLA